jgi:molybdenum cofactor cytidylyltransferase
MTPANDRATHPSIAALVPAAGYSSRMQTFKPLLPFGEATVIERVVATLRAAGVETTRVVVGWQMDRLVPVLERCGVSWVSNPRYAEGMYTSIQSGVQSLPAGVAAFFLLPGDMPLVRSGTLVRLMAAWGASPGGILYPTFGGRRGHPPLIASGYAPEILAETLDGGLRTLLARHAAHTWHLECDDPGILMDLDTPEEYRKALRAESLG